MSVSCAICIVLVCSHKRLTRKPLSRVFASSTSHCATVKDDQTDTVLHLHSYRALCRFRIRMQTRTSELIDRFRNVYSSNRKRVFIPFIRRNKNRKPMFAFFGIKSGVAYARLRQRNPPAHVARRESFDSNWIARGWISCISPSLKNHASLAANQDAAGRNECA